MSDLEAPGPVPEDVFAYVSVASQGGQSAFGAASVGPLASTEPFHASPADQREAARALEDHGIRVLATSPLGIAVVGPPDAYAALTGGTIVPRERLQYAERGRQRYVTHLDIVGPDQPTVLGLGRPAAAATRIEGVLLERPRSPHAAVPSPLPPTTARFHLRLPDDVAVGLGAGPAHRAGHVGQGVVVSMVDTGHFPHSFFQAHGYAAEPARVTVPGTDPTTDPLGHGTGESANIFAVAPGATLRPYRASNDAGKLVATLAAFLQAKADKPAILTNSWGADTDPGAEPDPADRAWALEIQHAIETGIIVVFSAGNGHFAIEPQVPGVLAAGGVYMAADLSLRVSDYASAYQSPWYPRVNVPDFCGLVGLRPRAQYLMLPVPPGSTYDVAESQPEADDPSGDGTAADDGWALFSGTSAAAPQVAGVVALLLGARPDLSVRQVTEAIAETARDVTTGHSHPRFNAQATVGPDVATGCGLVHASAALQYALSHF